MFWRASSLVAVAFVLGSAMAPLVHMRPGSSRGSARVTHIEAIRHVALRTLHVEARRA